ncbi:MAG: cyclic nucleotide-binding domain-containing protein [Desulfobacterales bacterium]|nr:cyclic nucleotide-binding domain-containing protein [Desulfobacterales bacterium]
MTSFFNKIFNIRTHEWPSVLLLFLMTVLSCAGFTWGVTIVTAAFLKEMGIEALPWAMVTTSVLSIVAIAVYSDFVDRVANDRLCIYIFVLEMAGLALGALLLRFNRPMIAYPFLYLLLFTSLAVVNPHQITYLNGFYDTRTARRVFPFIMAGYRTGAIIAGSTMALLTSWFDFDKIILIWLLTHLAMTALVWIIPYVLKGQNASPGAELAPVPPVAASDPAKQGASYIRNTREAFHYVIQSSFLRWMAAGALLMAVCMTLLEYRSNAILLAHYGSREELANFFALLVVMGNLFVLPMLFFGVSRIIGRVGLAAGSLIFPVCNLVICGALVAFPGLISGSAAWLDRSALRTAIHAPIDNLLYNAVPMRIKGRVRAFTNGLVTPVGMLLGGLLVIPSLSEFVWFTSALIGVFAAVYMISALAIRGQYARALIKMLEQEDYSFLLTREASELNTVDPATLKTLEEKMEESADPTFIIFMAQLISRIGGAGAVDILIRAVSAARDPDTRAGILDVMTAAGVSGRRPRKLYTDLLSDSNGNVRQSALAGLEQGAGGGKAFRELALKAIRDPDIEVRVQALSALARSGRFYRMPRAAAVLDSILASEHPRRQALGVRVLGKISDDRAARTLMKHLTNPADEVRLQAATTMETLPNDLLRAETFIDPLRERMFHLLHDPVERIRQAALTILDRIDGPGSRQALVDRLTDISQPVRAAATTMLVKAGKEVIPLLRVQMDSPDPDLRKMSAYILGRIAPREFEPFLSSYISDNLLIIYQNCAYSRSLSPYTHLHGVLIFLEILSERNQRLRDEIYYLLSAMHGEEAIHIIVESLRGESPRVRANALEALESLTDPDVVRLMGPLHDPDISREQLLRIGEEMLDVERVGLEETIDRFTGEASDAWTRAVMLFALGEMDALAHAARNRSPGPDPPSRASAPFQPVDVVEKSPRSAAHDSHEETRRAGQAETGLARGAETETFSAARLATRRSGAPRERGALLKEEEMLSRVEKIIFLKKVPFFEHMTIEQLKILAVVCEEKFFEEDTVIFNEGDPGGALYMIISGKVGIEQEGRRKGSVIRLATLGAYAYFGEITLFDNSPRTACAIAVQDVICLRMRREPLIALIRQHPDMSLELINVLSQRVREISRKVARMSRTQPRELHKLFDQFK